MNPIRQPFRTRKDAFALHALPRVGNSSWVLEIVIDNPSIPPPFPRARCRRRRARRSASVGLLTSIRARSRSRQRYGEVVLLFWGFSSRGCSRIPAVSLAPRALDQDPDLLFSREPTSCRPPNVSDRLLCGFLFDHGFLLFSEPETLSWIRDPTWPKWADGLHRGSAVGIPEVDSRSLRSLCSHEWKALLLGISRDTLFHTKNTEAAQRLDTGSNTKGNDSSGRSTT